MFWSFFFLIVSALMNFILGYVIKLECDNFLYTEGIDQNGLIISIFAAGFTQPMFPILALLFLKSCQDMQNLCNQAQGLPQCSMTSGWFFPIHRLMIDGDVSYRDTLNNA